MNCCLRLFQNGHKQLFLSLLLGMFTTMQAASNKEPKQLFLLFHGLGNHASSFNTLKKGIEKEFPTASVIAFKSVEGIKSLQFSTQEQVEMNFQELQEKVPNLTNKSIVLIGHSHGGIRAYTFLQKYQDQLHIKGLVALSTPWEGAPGTRVNQELLTTQLTPEVLSDLRILSEKLGHPVDKLENQFVLEINNNQMICLLPGAKDMLDGSPLLCEIKQTLPQEETDMLFVAGGQNDWGTLVPKPAKRLKLPALNKMYKFLAVGEGSPKDDIHDMKVPRYSQHAKKILPKGKKNLQRVFIKDAFHDTHVLTIIPVPRHKEILAHPRTVKAVIRFAKKVLTRDLKKSKASPAGDVNQDKC
ncbi:MAG: hypothetical protein K2X94_04865 [Amoebophilaceae bacterium]|nr:hypothetical protein [Amoebophilaceae bacterium]